MKNTALIVSGLIFSIIAFVHFVRYFKAYEVMFAHYVIPVNWSLYAGIIIAALAVWMFVAAKR